MTCPTCGVEQHWKIINADEPDEHGFVSLVGVKQPTEFIYSCVHYQDLCEHPRCIICGKRDSPVCQVPVSLPFSDCYCDNPSCVEAVRILYLPTALDYEFQVMMRDRDEYPEQHEALLRHLK